MCTAATYKTKDFYMGRTLDYEFSYGDEITDVYKRQDQNWDRMEEILKKLSGHDEIFYGTNREVLFGE